MTNDLHGWLFKRGQKAKTWKRRFVVINSGVLRYFRTRKESEDGSAASGEVPLASSKVLLPNPGTDSAKEVGRAHAFCIVTDTVAGGRTLWCAPESEETRMVWAKNIAHAAKLVSNHWKVFGMHLEQGFLSDEEATLEVPWVVSKCVDYIDRYGLESEGIYRLSGHFSKVSEAKAAFARGEEYPFVEGTDVHVVAGIFKQWLRELEDPLLTFKMYPQWIAAGRLVDKDECKAKLISLASELPLRHRSTLRTLIYHMARVAADAEKNKMTVENLAVVIGPNILRPGSGEDSMAALATDSRAVVNAVAGIIENRDVVFADLPPEDECITAASCFPSPPGTMGISMDDPDFGGALIEAASLQKPPPKRKYTVNVHAKGNAANGDDKCDESSDLPPPPPPAGGLKIDVFAHIPPPPQNNNNNNNYNNNINNNNNNIGRPSQAHRYIEEDDDDEYDDDTDHHHNNKKCDHGNDNGKNPYCKSGLSNVENDQGVDDDNINNNNINDKEPEKTTEKAIAKMAKQLELVNAQLFQMREDHADVLRRLDFEKSKSEAMEQRIFELEARLN